MNKHNSVTSTYYLLLKHKKGECLKELERQGKKFNKYYEVCNEKQELIDLLMSYEPTRKREKPKSKVIEISHKPILEDFKEKDQLASAKINNIEIIPKAKSSQRRVKKKQDVSMEYKTINHPDISNLNEINESDFHTVDYNMTANTRNVGNLPNGTNTIASSKGRTKNITYIKSRRTGSTDCTNTKLNKKEIQRISNFQKKVAVDLDTMNEGEIIVSNRGNAPQKNSPSPSPVKYNIEPTKNKPFDMNHLLKKGNYESVKNKK